MKKRVLLLLAGLSLAAVMVLSGCSPEDEDKSGSGSKASSTGVTINVYNWGEYIDDEEVDVLKAFTRETGIGVSYDTFTDNESMYTRLASGTVIYDVIVPSDYMIGKMIKENMLQKLDFDNIPNMKYIDETLKNPHYDETNEYSVPYTWGTVGIFYNSKHVDAADLAGGWDLLWNEKYSKKIVMFGNPRDAFGVSLRRLGYSMNSTNPDEYEKAYQELVKQKPLLYQYAMDELYDKMIIEDAWIAPYYAGDALIMMDEETGNPDIKFFFPEQGTNWFVDAMCVPVGAKHKAEAEAFINFMCRTDIAKANAEYIGYSTPHTEARKQLDPAIGENEFFYPDSDWLNSDKVEVFLTLPDSINALIDDYWRKLTI